MGGKRKKAKKGGLFQFFFILVVLFGGGGFLIQNNTQVENYVEEKAPVVNTIVDKSAPVLKNISGSVVRGAKGSYEFISDKVSEMGEDDADIVDDANPDQLTISSFNIRIFSDRSRDEEELDLITDILKKYDLIAIQELRDEEILKRAVRSLRRKGYRYNYEISEKVGRGVKEQYAFLYRKDKVKVLENGKLYQEYEDEFIREPYYATFKSGSFDFTLVTVHVLFGKSKSDRRPELKELAYVYNTIQDLDKDEQDVILLGDFNFSPSDKGWAKLKEVSTMKYLIKPPHKTTIQDSSLYDNIWFQKKYVKEYANRVGIYKFDEKKFNNNDKVASKMVSDHRPIWSRFNTNLEDDD